MKKREQRQLLIAKAIQNVGKENELSSFDLIDSIEQLVRIERKISRARETQANGYPVYEYKAGQYRHTRNELTPEQDAKLDAIQKRLFDKAKAIAKTHNWFITDGSGDPRGAGLEIDFFTNFEKEGRQPSHTHILFI